MPLSAVGRFRRARSVVEPVERRLMLSASIRTLASFAGPDGQGLRESVVVDAGGNVYGVSDLGGPAGHGVVYKVAANSGAVTVLATFAGAYDGAPQAVVLDAHGNLFGTTSAGGANNVGRLFEIPAGTANLVTLASFGGSAGSGDHPIGRLAIDAHGNVYGTTMQGGSSSQGAVFEWAAGSSVITTLASFNGVNGRLPVAGVTLDARGNLYGEASFGGANDHGTLFELPAGGHAIMALASFATQSGGQAASGAVAVDADGNVFGARGSDGAFQVGSVYEVRAGSGVVTTLTSFFGYAGALPVGGVVLDPRGNLFGVTMLGGDIGQGTVYELPAGSSTVVRVASFDAGDGQVPEAGLTFDLRGNLYGTTAAGGIYGVGTVFELPSAIATRAQFSHWSPADAAGVPQHFTVELVGDNASVDERLNTPVTLSIVSGPAGGRLTGTTSVQSVDGVALFTDVEFTAGGTYVVTATAAGVTPASAVTVQMLPPATTRLAFVQQPANAVAGELLPLSSVEALNALGELSSASDGDELSIVAEGPGGITATALVDPTLVHGQASLMQYAALTVAGTWTLRLTDVSAVARGETSFVAVSSPFAIVPAAPSRLVLSSPVASITAGHPIGPVTVRATDAYGNPVAVDGLRVTLSADDAVVGTSTVETVAGVAVFSDVTVDRAGTYVLTATHAGMTCTVVPMQVMAIPTTATTPAVLVAGNNGSVDVSTLVDPASRSAEPLQVQIVRQSDGKVMSNRSTRAKAGQVTVPAAAIRQAGGYVITVTNRAGQTVTQAVQVIAATPAKLAVAVRRGTGATSTVAVTVVDRFGNATSAADGIDVTLAVGPGDAAADTAMVAGGVAVFDDVPIGRNHLIAKAAGLHAVRASA